VPELGCTHFAVQGGRGGRGGQRTVLQADPLGPGTGAGRRPSTSKVTFCRGASRHAHAGLAMCLANGAGVVGSLGLCREWIERERCGIWGRWNAERCKLVTPRLSPPCVFCLIGQRRVERRAGFESHNGSRQRRTRMPGELRDRWRLSPAYRFHVAVWNSTMPPAPSPASARTWDELVRHCVLVTRGWARRLRCAACGWATRRTASGRRW
jgi:hypothetical protein